MVAPFCLCFALATCGLLVFYFVDCAINKKKYKNSTEYIWHAYRRGFVVLYYVFV